MLQPWVILLAAGLEVSAKRRISGWTQSDKARERAMACVCLAPAHCRSLRMSLTAASPQDRLWVVERWPVCDDRFLHKDIRHISYIQCDLHFLKGSLSPMSVVYKRPGICLKIIAFGTFLMAPMCHNVNKYRLEKQGPHLPYWTYGNLYFLFLHPKHYGKCSSLFTKTGRWLNRKTPMQILALCNF